MFGTNFFALLLAATSLSLVVSVPDFECDFEKAPESCKELCACSVQDFEINFGFTLPPQWFGTCMASCNVCGGVEEGPDLTDPQCNCKILKTIIEFTPEEFLLPDAPKFNHGDCKKDENYADLFFGPPPE